MASQSHNLFDKLPDEIVSRIFTLGCDSDINELYFEGSHAIERQPYPFTRSVSLICTRFRYITEVRSNSHLFYVHASLSDNDGKDFSTIIVNFCRALEISDRCDIHLTINLFFYFNRTTETLWRLVLHAMERVVRYSSQLVAIRIASYWVPPVNVVWWILRWFERCSHPSPRLSLARILIGVAEVGVEWNTYHLLDDDTSATSTLEFRIPSLTEVRLTGLPVDCILTLLKTHCLTTLVLSLNPNSTSEPNSSWPLVVNLLATCRTLRNLAARVTSVKGFFQEASSSLKVGLQNMLVVVDSLSLSALFDMFSFPALAEATIFVRQVPHLTRLEHDVGRRYTSSIHLPSLSDLKFFDSTKEGVSFLRLCDAPSLERFTVKTSSHWKGGSQPLRLHSPSSLVVGVVGTDFSIAEQLWPLDLSETIYLTISSHDILSEELFNQLENSSFGFRIKLPCLQALSVLSSRSLSGILSWLQSQFELPPHFALKFGESYDIKAEVSIQEQTSRGSGLSSTHSVVSLKVNLAPAPFSRDLSIAGLWMGGGVHLRQLDEAFPSFVETHRYGFSQALKPEECFATIYQDVKCLELGVNYSDVGGYLIISPWLRFLAEFVSLPPFPSLEVLKLRIPDLPEDDEGLLFEAVKETIASRAAGPVPIKRVEIRFTRYYGNDGSLAIFEGGNMWLEEWVDERY